MWIRNGGWGLCFLLCVGIVGCDRNTNVETPASRVDAAKADPSSTVRARTETTESREFVPAELLLGELRLSDDAVIDGDTIRVRGLDASVRLLAIDTEEVPRPNSTPAPWGDDFERYRAKQHAQSVRFPKYATPLGEEAKRFAEEFFAGATLVRLHRDHPQEIRGDRGRYLAYADVKKDGRWVSYNVECVRAGLSPYFTKYGYSRRYHDALTQAEAEARAAKRGIWSDDAEGYGDYAARVRWWKTRADDIEASERELSEKSDFVALSRSDAISRLEALVGREATVLSTVGRIEHFKRLVRVSLSMADERTFPVIFFDRQVFDATGIERFEGGLVRVRGTVERYQKGSYRTLQIVVTDPSQVRLSSPP